jgi:hypothetical protein
VVGEQEMLTDEIRRLRRENRRLSDDLRIANLRLENIVKERDKCKALYDDLKANGAIRELEKIFGKK